MAALDPDDLLTLRVRLGALLTGSAGRFLLIGGVATVVDVALFNVLHYGAGVGPLTSKVLATLAAAVIAFVGNRQFSFGDQAGAAVHRQLVAFVAVNAAALALNLLPLAVARYGLGLTGALALNVAGNVLGLALATGFRFYGYGRWVFPPRPVAAPLPATAQDVRLAA